MLDLTTWCPQIRPSRNRADTDIKNIYKQSLLKNIHFTFLKKPAKQVG